MNDGANDEALRVFKNSEGFVYNPNSMSHIFISHSSKDKAYVHKLQAALQKRGFEVWIDENMDGGQWDEAIEKRIDECAAFVVVLSQNSRSASAKWVKPEIVHAKDKEKTILPLLLQGENWMMLKDLNYFNVTDGSLPDEKFFQRLAMLASRNKSPLPSGEGRVRKKQPAFNFDPKLIVGILFGIVTLIGLAFVVPRLFNQPATNVAVTSQVTATLPPTETATFAPTFTSTTPPLLDEITDAKGIKMRLVPAGNFTMGSEKYDWEKPIHSVYLDAFYMDKYEVTNAAYKLCVDAGTCQAPKESKSYTRSSYYGNSEFNDYLVIYVDWNMAKNYCSWREAKLPTEAEWEKAARGTDERIYPWGNTFDGTVVNFCDKNCINANKNVDDGYADTSPVGNYKSGKSPYGIYDMAGNVWEWTSSLYKSYPYNANDGREDLIVSGDRVMRGGSWNIGVSSVSSVNRRGLDPTYAVNYIGFRCSRSHP